MYRGGDNVDFVSALWWSLFFNLFNGWVIWIHLVSMYDQNTAVINWIGFCVGDGKIDDFLMPTETRLVLVETL